MKKIIDITFIFLILLVGISCKQHSSKNPSTDTNDWVPLFNGIDLKNWTPKFHHSPVGLNFNNTFRVKDSIIQVNYDQYENFDERYGHLFYNEVFSSFHLLFSYRFTDEWMEDAPTWTYKNSGIMFHSQHPNTILKEQDWPISIEFQILAGDNLSDSVTTGNMCSPGTEVFINDSLYPNHCINSSSQSFPYNKWIKGELIVYKDSLIKHIINGDVVLEYSKPQIGGGTVNGYDPQIKKDGKPLKEGYIALQAEGQGVEFKDIYIKKL